MRRLELPVRVVLKDTATGEEAIRRLCLEANAAEPLRRA